MRRLLVNFLMVLTIFFLFNTKIFAFQEEDSETFEFSEIEDALQTVSSVSNYPDVNSKHIVVIDRESKRILFEKDAFSKTPMASTTKILTAIIALETCDLSEIVPVSKASANVSGSSLGLISGSKMSMQDLLYGLMLRSGNDCAVAIAEYIAGDIEGFSKIMNKKAKDLGLKDSNFTSPHGLDDKNHYTTAYELALITDYALNNENFRKIVGTKEATIKINDSIRTISNTNELLGNYDGIYGVKTGFTFNGGRCLVSACKKDGLDLIAVVLGADSKKFRTLDSIKVLNYTFKNFTKIDITNIIYEEFYKFEDYYLKNVTLYKSTNTPHISLPEYSNIKIPLKKDELNNISSEIYSLSVLHSPLQKNTKIGEITIKTNNEILFSSNIMLSNSLTRKTWKVYYKEIFKNFFNI